MAFLKAEQLINLATLAAARHSGVCHRALNTP
jgi:hypothetical protein